MSIRWLTPVLVFAISPSLLAQVHVSGGGVCAKPNPSYSIIAPDRPGHVFSLGQYQCTWTKPFEIAGTKTKEGPDIIYVEIQGNHGDWREFYVDTTSTGDTGYYRLHGTAIFKDGTLQSLRGRWTLDGGTGKLQGIKGSGTCTGKGEADGGVSYECEGEYSAPK
jgi:hypothetical protein